MRKLGTTYQYILIAFGLIATALFSVFLKKEIYPEYRIYQQDYIALEDFRSSYTKEPPPAFKEGVKQIVIERDDKGPPVIDRCTSCHVALQIEDFSPTKIARDLNGNIIYDPSGTPEKIENPNFVWKKLDEAINESKDPSQIQKWEALKTAQVGEYAYNVKKVLSAHPLIGKETRPFEFHPIEDYGCVSCHGGNGRGLVTDRAHGPVFDGQYEKESVGFVPKFLETDPLNDPQFAHVFNAKPGHRLLFQVNPLYVGALIQANCIKCHQTSQEALDAAKESAKSVLKGKESAIFAAEKSYQLEKWRVQSLLRLNQSLKKNGYEKTLVSIEASANDYTLPEKERDAARFQEKFFQKHTKQTIQAVLSKQLIEALGSKETVDAFEKEDDFEKTLKTIKEQKGSLFEKRIYYNYVEALMQHITDVSGSLDQTMNNDELTIGAIKTDVDFLTKDYQNGKDLFVSQGCYACHRIAGFSRGGVGPELTKSGESYPWFIKESIVWPQADLKTSTMPNMRLDHEEVEALVTYLLGQTGKNQIVGESSRKAFLQEWELGKKQPIEKPITEKQIQSLKYGMTVFATEGCASCHRLLGYESDVGFKQESEKENRWFQNLFPEFINGSDIVRLIEKNGKEIDEKIDDHARKDSLIEQIETSHPGSIEALYSNFKFAKRAKNHESHEVQIKWKTRVNKVFKMFIQTYGLGRVICPKTSWSGIYRSDQWLLEHFINPSSHVPRSIMPVFPFDETKFYALTETLDKLAKLNVEKERTLRKKEGFNPEAVFEYYCSQCHGEYLQGNGPVSEWIYPPPKNLKNPEFLRSLTKEKAIDSIMHGVQGTPMAPWGEMGAGKSFENNTPVLTEGEIHLLVDWLFSNIPGGTVIRKSSDVPKWNYNPSDVIQELKDEGNQLKSNSDQSFSSIFDENTPKIDSEKAAYFIKQKYYTKENIRAGEHYFIENCAPCHGKEADGAGTRVEAMHDAKPRMLTNLDWIESRDDLRLLRSIKYGIPGTSMTPWGDFTSSLQRLQLVIFIRSLNEGKVQKRKFDDALYAAFDTSVKNGEQIKSIEMQKELFRSVGKGFLTLGASNKMLETYILLVQSHDNAEKKKALQKELIDQIDQEIDSLNKEKQLAPNIKQIDVEINAWTKQKNLLIFKMAEAGRIKNHDNSN